MWLPKSIFGALLGIAGGIAVGVVLLCFRPNETRTLDKAATQVVDAERARTVAARAIVGAKLNAQAAQRTTEVAVAQAVAAHTRARIDGQDKVIVSEAPNAMPMSIRVPPPVVERMRLDSGAVAALGTLVQRKETVILAQDQRISADSLALIATSNAFTALQRVKEPRCGRKCGIVLGVGGMIAAAVAVEQVRRVFR